MFIYHNTDDSFFGERERFRQVQNMKYLAQADTADQKAEV